MHARTRIATLAAVALAAVAVAVPTAAACPLDMYDNCLVVSPDTRKAPTKAGPAKTKPAKPKAVNPRARLAHAEPRSGR